MTSGWRDIWIEGAAQYFSFSWGPPAHKELCIRGGMPHPDFWLVFSDNVYSHCFKSMKNSTSKKVNCVCSAGYCR
jgi:hypothetical protein